MNLLLVEDDTMLAEALCAGMRQHGFHVDTVGDAARARTALVDHSYDAVAVRRFAPLARAFLEKRAAA